MIGTTLEVAMSEIRIGFVGVGQIAKRHLKRYADIDGVKVVAASDIDEHELESVCDLHGIEHRYTDFRKMLKRDDIDAVEVCLHNNYHAPATIAAFEAGHHVYCEKPIAGTYTDGKAMMDAAQAAGKMFHIQLATLYSKETKAAKILIDAGKLGKLYHARSMGYRRRGRPFVDGYGSKTFVQKEVSAGGALFDMGVYHIAQILYLLNTPGAERISGKIYQETSIDQDRKRESGYNVEEMGIGLVRFPGGLTLDIIEAWAIQLNAFEGSSIAGSEGGVRLDPFSFHTTFCDLDMNATFDLGSMEYRRHQLKDNEGAYDSSQHHWIAALRGEVALIPTAKIALETMLIQEGIYLSDSMGREVTSEEVGEHSVSKSVDI